MTATEPRGPDRLAEAERVFEALSALDLLTVDVPARTDRQSRVTMGELYGLATNADEPLTARMIAALENEPRLRGDLERLIAKTALYRLPRAAAAASPGAVATREGTGFRITLKQSKADPKQIYIIIDLARRDATPPAHIFVLGEEIRYCKASLPAPANGTIQLLADSRSDLVRALGDHRSEVFLR